MGGTRWEIARYVYEVISVPSEIPVLSRNQACMRREQQRGRTVALTYRPRTESKSRFGESTIRCALLVSEGCALPAHSG